MTHPADHPITVVDENVIHDLLNPLTAILGNLHFLDDLLRDSAPPIVLKRLDAGVGSAEEMRSMFENLRYLMAPEARPPIPATPFNLGAILHTLNVPCDTEGQNRVTLRGDEELIRRAIDALFRAVSRIDRQPTTTLDTATPGAVQLRFTHRGRNLPRELAASLFDPGLLKTQADLGLKIDRAHGLWFARTVVEAHHGSIRYHPQADGGTILVSLPSGET